MWQNETENKDDQVNIESRMEPDFHIVSFYHRLLQRRLH